MSVGLNHDMERSDDSNRGNTIHIRLPPTIALVDWSHLHEDFLDSIGVSFDSFLTKMTGGWLFGYIDALQLAGVRTVFFCVSSRVLTPQRFTHVPTGATVCVLPAPSIYRHVRGTTINPNNYYVAPPEQSINRPVDVGRILRRARREVAPYLATPLRHLAHELRHEQCQAIVCQDYEHARFDACVLLGRKMHLPVFATFQGGVHHLSVFERPVRPLTMHACTGLIIGPETEVRRVLGRYHLPKAKVARIFNPLDVTAWRGDNRDSARTALGIPDSAGVIIWHGRVDIRRKGLDVLLSAWQAVRIQRPDRDLRLILVGTGHEAAELRRMVAVMPDDIQWVDEYVHDRERLRRYLSAADVYAFPSRHEGFPVAPIEAMACGLPVVAADAPGVPDIFEEGELSGGIVVPCADSTAMATALGRLLDDPIERRLLGDRARQRAEEAFSLEAVGAQLHDALLEAPRIGG